MPMVIFIVHNNDWRWIDVTIVVGNWKRLSELLHAMKSKHSGMEEMVELVEAELELETFLEQQGG